MLPAVGEGRLLRDERQGAEGLRLPVGGDEAEAAAESEGLSLSGMKSRIQRARSRLKASLLECCRIALDRRGGIVGCEARTGGKGPCGRSGCHG